MLLRLGKYLLIERINQGGMADVYLAKALGYQGADPIVALKCIRPEISSDPAFVAMFVDEAKLSVLLTHANIAQIFELGCTDSRYFIAMEHVAGRDLRAVIDRANHQGVTLPETLVLHVVCQVLEGLDYAHRKTDPSGRALQIVHQDVSPQNVILGFSGAIKLIDFGIAKAATQVGERRGQVLRGKYGYMSPEQLRGLPIDHRADVFAAGVLLYELLTQRRLFDGSSDVSILEKVRYSEIYPPTVIAPRISTDLESIVLKALASRPEDRYSSASDMHDTLTRVMLRQYGAPFSRDLSALMQNLFAHELRADLELVEEARRITHIPPGTGKISAPVSALPLADVDEDTDVDAPAKPARPEVTARDADDAAALADHDTDRFPPRRTSGSTNAPMAAPWSRPSPRDFLVLGVAALLATTLIICTWLLTRQG